MERLIEKSATGLAGYTDAVTGWIDGKKDVDSQEKEEILRNLFDKTRVAIIYGAAGTGKTYLVNLVSRFLDARSKLYLANTNPAVENLRRKIEAQNCEFMTIRKYVMGNKVPTDVDVLVMDECSMVSNADMAKVLAKCHCKIMLLVGDTYQIEPITFGNWFQLAKYFLPRDSWYELKTPYRTKDENLLMLWEKVRNMEDDITELVVGNRYSKNIDYSVFDRKTDDEIILCLNYDGLYGINNINRFLQENNPNPAVSWGMSTFKAGDPILFNESERFAPLIYNNLKGKILDVAKETDDMIYNLHLKGGFPLYSSCLCLWIF